MEKLARSLEAATNGFRLYRDIAYAGFDLTTSIKAALMRGDLKTAKDVCKVVESCIDQYEEHLKTNICSRLQTFINANGQGLDISQPYEPYMDPQSYEEDLEEKFLGFHLPKL